MKNVELVSRASNAASSYTVTLARSVIEASSPTQAAVRLAAASLDGTPTFNVLSNQITSIYDGIGVELGSGRANILGNRVGRILPSSASLPAVFAISVEGRGAGGPAVAVQIARNITFNFSAGVFANAISAPLNTRVINNTIARSTLTAIDLRRSVPVGGSPPAHTGRVANNLVTRAQCGLGFNSSATTVTADYNFFHATGENTCLGASAGANDRTGTPQFVGGYDFRTRASSPNVDVGNNADQPSIPIIVAVPTPDFDSRNGRVNDRVDIGAYEFSVDASYEHASTAANTMSNISRVTRMVTALARIT
jgi:hypothetical protein